MKNYSRLGVFIASFLWLVATANADIDACRVYNTAAVSISNSTDSVISFNSERFDFGNLHSTSTNTSRITVAADGIYTISGSINFAVNSSGIRALYVRHNGTTDIAGQSAPANASNSTSLSINTIYALSAGDYVELFAYQTSGSSLNVTAGGNYSPEFSLVYLKDQADGTRVYNNAAQSISNTTDTAIALNSERYDFGNLHDTSTNNSRITASVGGIYQISGSVNFAANATGLRVLYIRYNGTTDIAGQSAPGNGSNSTSITTSTLYHLDAGDYIEMFAYQASGGSLNVTSGGNYSPELSLQLVRGD